MTASIPQRTFHLAAPYWLRSDQRHHAWALGAALLALVVVTTGLNVWTTQLQRGFFDALQDRHPRQFAHAIALFFGAVALFIGAAAFKRYLEMGLEMRWRQQLTDSLLGQWLGEQRFYRMERDNSCDNPDQRLSQDVSEYVRLMIGLSLGFLANLGTLGSMGWILWQSAGPISFALGDGPDAGQFTIPGYLFWVAIGWGLLQTLATHLSGRRLAGATVEQQSAEADFRFALAKVRDAAEQIALYQGQAIEHQRLARLFANIRRNWSVLMVHNVYLNLTSAGFSVVSAAVPILAMAPKVLSGHMSLGTLMQDVTAFAATAASVAWFALSYRDLFNLSARVQRLSAMQAVMARPRATGITVQREDSPLNVAGQDVALALPDGRLLSRIGQMLFAPGERWLVRGPSGCGKSTLLRAIGGLWPFGGGLINLRPQARVMFIPQRSYLPDGPLEEALAYPLAADSVRQRDPQAFARALTDCRLPHLVPRLGQSARWGHQLSPGEQQRLAFAQALLFAPDLLFMDESTSALDNDTEAHLMQLLLQRLPQCTVVSVAHRTTLDAFHDRRLELQAPAAA